VEFSDGGVVWHNEGADWHKQLQENDKENNVLSAETIARERIARQTAGDNLHAQNTHDNQQRVQIVRAERRDLEGGKIIFEREVGTEPNIGGAERLVRRMQRNGKSPENGNRPTDGENSQRQRAQAMPKFLSRHGIR
jgi:hypothetical protein